MPAVKPLSGLPPIPEARGSRPTPLAAIAGGRSGRWLRPQAPGSLRPGHQRQVDRSPSCDSRRRWGAGDRRSRTRPGCARDWPDRAPPRRSRSRRRRSRLVRIQSLTALRMTSPLRGSSRGRPCRRRASASRRSSACRGRGRARSAASSPTMMSSELTACSVSPALPGWPMSLIDSIRMTSSPPEPTTRRGRSARSPQDRTGIPARRAARGCR